MKVTPKAVSIYMILACLCDGTSGLLLVCFPQWTLQLMGIQHLPLEPVYMQWIGAFVFGVGTSYLLPFLVKGVTMNLLAKRGILLFTAYLRIWVALFVAGAILTGSLEIAWLSVCCSDALLAAIQIILLRLAPAPRPLEP